METNDDLKSASARGATLLPRTRLVAATRERGRWRVALEAANGGQAVIGYILNH